MHTSPPDRPDLPAGPEADCTADSAGGLTFDIDLPGREEERWDAALLLRVRGAGAADGVRLPLFPSARGRLRASLPSTMELAEGCWDSFLVLGEEEPQRLRSGRHDLRSLVDREPSAHRTWLGVRIPYATEDTGLTLRAWQRWPHAEVRDLEISEAGLRVRGRLYGAEPGAAARLEARPRDTAAGDTVTAEVCPAGPDFHGTLSWAAFPGTGEWDLWLRATGAGPAVRVGRILDDVAEKNRDVPLPVRRAGRSTVAPFWTRDNDLALRVGPAARASRPRGSVPATGSPATDGTPRGRERS